ncbi:hypothetical protein, partial [Hydrogenovibrio marinus]
MADKKRKLPTGDVLVVVICFALVVLSPSRISPESIYQHVSGIALGFGLAWLIKMLINSKKVGK